MSCGDGKATLAVFRVFQAHDTVAIAPVPWVGRTVSTEFCTDIKPDNIRYQPPPHALTAVVIRQYIQNTSTPYHRGSTVCRTLLSPLRVHHAHTRGRIVPAEIGGHVVINLHFYYRDPHSRSSDKRRI